MIRWYDVAQICANGHVANFASVDRPQHNQKFCEKCGAETRTDCSGCGAPIRGEYHSTVTVIGGSEPEAPAFCVGCGAPFPWTGQVECGARVGGRTALAVSGRAAGTGQKSSGSRLADNPLTPVAATRFKRLMNKAGTDAGAAFKQILISTVTEAAKGILWPS